MRRRDFITLLGSAAAWPLAARAQQPAMPVIGFLSPGTAGQVALQMRPAAFLQALSEQGFVEGRNVTFEDRVAEGRYERLTALAEDLVRARVALIFAGSPPAVRAAMTATTTIPIVFGIGEDPVKERLVASLSRPGGNVTGHTNFSNQLVPKRLELLHQIAPQAAIFGLLVNPTNPNADPDTREVQAAADALGLRLEVLGAHTGQELEAAFAAVTQKRLGALMVGVDPWFRDRPEQIAALASRHAVPAIYERASFAAAGGLISYGTSETERARQSALLIVRILTGAKPADLPVMQATKFELTINLKTARALGLKVSQDMLSIADEVIE